METFLCDMIGHLCDTTILVLSAPYFVWSSLLSILAARERGSLHCLTLSNRFGFETIAETMEYSYQVSGYSESSNEVNDENKNSLQLMNPLMGVKSMTEPLLSLVSLALNQMPTYQSVPLSF
jgi:hypothetical protein